jgi:hypothetical protein
VPRDPVKQRAYQQRYNQSTKGLAAQQRYSQSAKGQGQAAAQGGDCLRARPDCFPALPGLTVLQPEFLEQFPKARFHFKSSPLAQRGTFMGVWLNEERTTWALEKEEEEE